MKKLGVLLVVSATIASVGCSIGETNYERLYLPVREEAQAVATCEKDDFVDVDVSKLEECGNGQGHCYDAKKILIGAGFEKCTKAGEVCVPDNVLTANGKKLKSCKALGGSQDGACMNIDLIPEMKKRAGGFLQQENCDEHQVCAPCLNPEQGMAKTGLCEEMGAHEKDCKGGGVAEETEACCYGLGSCLSPEGLPPDARGDLGSDTCSDAKLCVPYAMVSGNAVKCEIGGLDGVCMSKCFNEMLAGAPPLFRTSCQPTEVCLPCALAAGRGMPGCD